MRAVLVLCGIGFAWQWVGAFLLTIISLRFRQFAESWQILPWLSVFFAPSMLLVSLTLLYPRWRNARGLEANFLDQKGYRPS
jgi:hypothetical protein